VLEGVQPVNHPQDALQQLPAFVTTAPY